jgi:activator-of-BECN1-regulated-autophagy protein 1
VRVWSIERNCCLKTILLEHSIISLAFHPNGEYIALASGTKLEIWHWQHHDNRLHTMNTTTPHRNPVEIFHVRNIRAALFHPNGRYLLAVAPNGPRIASDAITTYSRYTLPFYCPHIR